MNEKRPLIVTFIGDISFLFSLLSIIAGSIPDYLTQIGFHILPLPTLPVRIILMLPLIILLVASVGFLRLKRWGYWLMVICNILLLAISLIWWQQSQNFIPTIIELIFIIPTKRYFYKETHTVG